MYRLQLFPISGYHGTSEQVPAKRTMEDRLACSYCGSFCLRSYCSIRQRRSQSDCRRLGFFCLRDFLTILAFNRLKADKRYMFDTGCIFFLALTSADFTSLHGPYSKHQRIAWHSELSRILMAQQSLGSLSSFQSAPGPIK